MEKEVFDYQTMRMQQDAQEAIAAEQAWLAAGGDAGEHPDLQPVDQVQFQVD